MKITLLKIDEDIVESTMNENTFTKIIGKFKH
jgi:hypothetical protein